MSYRKRDKRNWERQKSQKKMIFSFKDHKSIKSRVKKI